MGNVGLLRLQVQGEAFAASLSRRNLSDDDSLRRLDGHAGLGRDVLQSPAYVEHQHEVFGGHCVTLPLEGTKRIQRID